MALALGTNSGFVTTAPTSDPSGGLQTAVAISAFGISTVTKDTSPSNAATITEIGWWCDGATQESNFAVGLYSDSSGAPSTRLFVSATNAKGTTAGWKTVSVNWTISGSTPYWIGVQCDETTTTTWTDNESSGGSGYDSKAFQTSLPNPFSGGALDDTDGMVAFYAVWQAALTVQTGVNINIGDAWKSSTAMQINIGDSWKQVTGVKVNIGDSWKDVSLA